MLSEGSRQDDWKEVYEGERRMIISMDMADYIYIVYRDVNGGNGARIIGTFRDENKAKEFAKDKDRPFSHTHIMKFYDAD